MRESWQVRMRKAGACRQCLAGLRSGARPGPDSRRPADNTAGNTREYLHDGNHRRKVPSPWTRQLVHAFEIAGVPDRCRCRAGRERGDQPLARPCDGASRTGAAGVGGVSAQRGGPWAAAVDRGAACLPGPRAGPADHPSSARNVAIPAGAVARDRNCERRPAGRLATRDFRRPRHPAVADRAFRAGRSVPAGARAA